MTEVEASVRILLLDDHVLFRESLRQALETDIGLCVVAEADDADRAGELAARLKPDVILVDAETPKEIVERIRRIQKVAPSPRVLVLTWHDDPWLVRSIVSYGVRGYLLKCITKVELVSAIRSVHARDRQVVLMATPETLVHAMQAGRPGYEGISQRERDILLLVAQGLSNAQIGRRLTITEGTVKRHLSNIYVKLGAASRVDAVNKAVTATIIPSLGRRRWRDNPAVIQRGTAHRQAG